ncbi:MAG: fused MFS/spermidine synthase, partial [Candidatus Omnitrophica bacterium]|nr:fused MFS/spermidine synthase [Candidatus Omnitrophota bacterium]
PIFLSSFVILAPLCSLLGFMFSLGCRIYDHTSSSPATKIGIVYVLEAIGAMSGGLLTGFILIRLFNSFQILGILGLLNVLVGFLLQLNSPQTRFKSSFVTGLTIFLILGMAGLIFRGWDNLHQYSLYKQWKDYKLLASENSIYGNIAIVEREGQDSFYYNGLHLYTLQDRLTSEEAVHFNLLEHPNPKKILLVGGGVGGLIEEITKHPIEKVDYLELDPLIIKMAKAYLHRAYSSSLDDPRVEIKHLDGRFFIKRAERIYDCIIIHLGDPYTAQLNRYYTVEFFKEMKNILSKDGIVSFAVTSSENYISRQLGDFLRSVYFSLREVFEDVKVLPGDTAYFLACPKVGILTYDYKILMERARERKLDIKYVREYYLFSKLSEERIAYIENSLKKKNKVKINYDFRPISYYYDIIFWTTRFSGSLFTKILSGTSETKIWGFSGVIYLLIFLYSLLKIKNREEYKKITLLAVATTGFSEITFQMLVLLSFQIIYGYVFYKLGIILTSFMIGLTLGGYWITKILAKLKNDFSIFIWTQVSICLYPLILALFFGLFSQAKGEVISWLGAHILFPFLPIIAGFIGGFQFPLANKIYLSKKEEIGQVAGLNYGMDLLGSCLGALLAGAFLIPILGIPKTCWVVAIMNLMVLIGLLLSLSGQLKYAKGIGLKNIFL